MLEKYESALLMILGFGGFSIILALIHNAVRKHIFHDEHNLDTTFDAGGNVTLSLTAVTVASQLIWPGDILHSATLTAKVWDIYYLVHRSATIQCTIPNFRLNLALPKSCVKDHFHTGQNLISHWRDTRFRK